MPIEAAFEACRRVTAERARSFYIGLRLAPEPERNGLYALYAWTRMGDDIADGENASSTERLDALDRFAARTADVFEGNPPDPSPVWVAVRETVRRWPCERAWFEGLIEGLRHDASQGRIDTDADLERYCDRVASNVGRMCVAVWGLRREHERERAYGLAAMLGQAFQITNILRDIGQDAAFDPPRCYIPGDALGASRLTAGSLAAWADPDACSRLVLTYADRAERAFVASEGLASLIRPAFVPTLWAMMRMYRETLAIIRRAPHRAAALHSPRPSALTKLGIAIGAAARLMTTDRAV
jgi:phytoene synthase